MKKILAMAIGVGLIFSGVALSKETLSEQDLKRLHAVSVRCDADNSGQPDIDTCVPTYQRLIEYYGGYEAFVAASKKYKM